MCQRASLPNFGTQPIVDAQAAGDWTQPTYSNMGDRSPVENDTYSRNGQTLLASPTAPTSTTDFTVQWHNRVSPISADEWSKRSGVGRVLAYP